MRDIGPNYVEISTKSVKDIYDVGYFDFVTSTSSMTFRSTWALILALILTLIRISARKLKCSPKRRFQGLLTANWPYHTGHIVTYRAYITIDK